MVKVKSVLVRWLLSGLIDLLERLLQRRSHESGFPTDQSGEPTPDFEWEAPQDWLERTAPRPPQDWLERVRAVQPNWAPSDGDLVDFAAANNSGAPQQSMGAGRQSDLSVDRPVMKRRGTLDPDNAVRFRTEQGVSLNVDRTSSRARPIRQHNDPPEMSYRRGEQRVPERIPLNRAAPPAHPDAAESAVITRKPLPQSGEDISEDWGTGSRMAQPFEGQIVNNRPSRADLDAAKVLIAPPFRQEPDAGRVEFAGRMPPVSEPILDQPRPSLEAERLTARPARSDISITENGRYGTPPAGSGSPEIWKVDADRWPALPNTSEAQHSQDDDSARRVRLDREQEGEDEWIA
jgi:hypothetical protein